MLVGSLVHDDQDDFSTWLILSISSLLLPIICFGGRKGFFLGGRAGMIAKWESDLLVKRGWDWVQPGS